MTVDGADEVDPQLRLIKGGGGALLREKIVASATKQMIVVADASKRVEKLGKFPLPVEVIKFAEALIAKRITALGAEVQLRAGNEGKPYMTDEDNHILDCRFGEIRDADRLARDLSEMPGVVEHGLFIGMSPPMKFTDRWSRTILHFPKRLRMLPIARMPRRKPLPTISCGLITKRMDCQR